MSDELTPWPPEGFREPPGGFKNVFPRAKPSSDGVRLGRMMASEPELTKRALTEADREQIRRFVDYVTADGFDAGRIVTRMERLTFETIVTGKTYGEVLADDVPPPGFPPEPP